MKNQDQDFFQTKILGVEIKNNLDEDKKVFFTLHHIILLLFFSKLWSISASSKRISKN